MTSVSSKAASAVEGSDTTAAVVPEPRAVLTFRIGLLDRLTARLTSRLAYSYFGGAFLVGVALMLFGGAQGAWLAVLPVVGYGGILIYAQAALYTRLNTTVKDSPYFLGFLLTLVGMVAVFHHISVSGAGDVPVDLVVKEAGGAVVATVVGLLLRQMTHSMDPADETREAVFESLADEVREQARRLRKDQKDFAKILTDFVNTRDALLSAETEAFKGWVKALETVGPVLTKMTLEYPVQVQTVLTEAGEMADTITAARSGLNDDFAELRSTLRGHITDIGTELRRAVDESGNALMEARTALQQRIDNLLAAAGDGVSLLDMQKESIGKTTNDYVELYGRLTNAIGGTDLAAVAAKNAMNTLATHAQSASGKLAQDLKTAGDTLTREVAVGGAALASALSGAGADAREALKAQMDAITADVKAIDELLNQVTELLRQRYQVNGVPEPPR